MRCSALRRPPFAHVITCGQLARPSYDQSFGIHLFSTQRQARPMRLDVIVQGRASYRTRKDTGYSAYAIGRAGIDRDRTGAVNSAVLVLRLAMSARQQRWRRGLFSIPSTPDCSTLPVANEMVFSRLAAVCAFVSMAIRAQLAQRRYRALEC